MKYLILSFLFVGYLFAANSGTLILSGTIPKRISIEVNTLPGYNNLDFSNSQLNLLVANIIEKSNTKDGYTVNLVSQNDGCLVNNVDTSKKIVYTAKYNSSNVVLSSSGSTVTDVSGGIVNVTKGFSISYDGQVYENLLEGVYSDTLIFTIASK